MVGDAQREHTVAENSLPDDLLDWESAVDPDNPRNWSFSKRAFNTGLPAIFAFLMYGTGLIILAAALTNGYQNSYYFNICPCHTSGDGSIPSGS
jgi:hypothetical protein